MIIGRRGALGLGALGVGLAALDGCGARPPALPVIPPSPTQIERLLADLDAVVRHLSTLDDPKTFGLKGESEPRYRGRQRSVALLTTLCFLGTYRELPEQVWSDPRVAAHMEAAMPRIRATLASARAQLAGMTDAELAAIDRRLQKEPELPMRILERIDGYASELDVPLAQRTYLRMSTLQLASRYRYEGTREVTKKLLSSYERMLGAKLAELGLPSTWSKADEEKAAFTAGKTSEALAKSWPGKSLGTVGESCEEDDDCEAGLQCGDATCVEHSPASAKALEKTAGRTAIIGAWLLIPPLCAVGVLVLLQALFMAIVAGIVQGGEH